MEIAFRETCWLRAPARFQPANPWGPWSPEPHGLAFLRAFKTTSLDRRGMHENVSAILTADKAVAFGFIEPLYCSLFHVFVLLFLFRSYVGGTTETDCRS